MQQITLPSRNGSFQRRLREAGNVGTMLKQLFHPVSCLVLMLLSCIICHLFYEFLQTVSEVGEGLGAAVA